MAGRGGARGTSGTNTIELLIGTQVEGLQKIDKLREKLNGLVGSQTKLSGITKRLSGISQIEKLSESLGSVQSSQKGFNKSTQKTITNLKKLEETQLKELKKELDEFNRKGVKQTKQMAASVKKTKKELDDLEKTKLKRLKADIKVATSRKPWDRFKSKLKGVGKVMNQFRMEFLGIMFAGMAMQRFFGGIIKSTTAVFTKIMESSGVAGTAVQRLGAHWEYLKFTIGSALNSALAPLMPMITKMIMKISEWIQKHPKLTSWILILGVAIGGLLFFFGQMGLAINSLIMLFKGPFGKAIGGLIKSFGKLIFGKNGLKVLKEYATKVTTKFGKLFSTMGKKGSTPGITGIIKRLGVIVIIISAIIAMYHIWTKSTASLSDKIVASIMIVAVAVGLVALIFGAWPVALVAAIVAMVAAIWIFRDQLVEGLKAWGLIFKKKFYQIKKWWKDLWGDKEGAWEAQKEIYKTELAMLNLGEQIKETDEAFKEKWSIGNFMKDQAEDVKKAMDDSSANVENVVESTGNVNYGTTPVKEVVEVDVTVNADTEGQWSGYDADEVASKVSDIVSSSLYQEAKANMNGG